MDLPHRNAMLVVAVAALAVLAGCTGGGGPSTATPTNNTTDSPANDTELEPMEELNGSYLNNATTAAVEDGGSYTRNTSYYYEINTTLQQSSSWANTTQRAEFDANRGVRQTTNTVLSEPPVVSTSTIYTDENGSYARVNESQNISYNSQSGLEVVNLTTYNQNYTFMTAAFEYEANGTETIDGTTTVRYTSTNLSDASYLGGGENVTVSNETSTLYVDADGVVRQAHVAYALEADRGTSETDLTITLTDIGSTTVEEPSWLSEATSATPSETPS